MDCPICFDTMETPFNLHQCTHSFHSTCIMKAMDVYLVNYGTMWQTVPCPVCRKRVSYHIILQDFIRTCNLQEAEEIINNRNIHTKCPFIGSILHVAASYGNIEIVKYLIKLGLPPDSVNNFELTPLYFAVHNGHIDVVKYLLENCIVNIDYENLFGETLLDVATKNCHTEIASYLRERGAKYGMLKNGDLLKNLTLDSPLVKLFCTSIIPTQR